MHSINFFSLFMKIARLSYLFGVACLALGMAFSLVAVPASAAAPAEGDSLNASWSPSTNEVCTPPADWDQTVRLFFKRKDSMEWQFEIDEPEMDVELEWFWYQDYDDNGCPIDCSTGKCQSIETGEGESPLGTFVVEDGKEGADGGRERQSGRLAQGSYTASFHVTSRGSINVGLKVHKKSVPTDTPVVTNTPTPSPTTPVDTDTPTPTATLPVPEGTTLTPSPTPTFTATATGTTQPPTPTSTGTPVIEPPESSPTPAASPTPTQTPSEISPTGTPVTPSTATPTEEPAEPTDIPTLPPPSGLVSTPKLIPVTGADHSLGNLTSPGIYQKMLLNIGIGLLGLGLLFHGLGSRPRKK